MLGSLTPVDPTDQAPTHALFGIAPEDAPVADGTADAHATKKTKKKKQRRSQTADEEEEEEEEEEIQGQGRRSD